MKLPRIPAPLTAIAALAALTPLPDLPRFPGLDPLLPAIHGHATLPAQTHRPQETSVAATLSGFVRDSAGTPIQHVQILLTPAGRQALSGIDGSFRFTSVPAGDYQLVASRVGYAPARHHVAIAPAATSILVTLTLVATPLKLPSIHVTGTTRGRDPLAVTQATTHLAGDDLSRERGPTLAHSLRTQPGLAVRSMGPAAAMPVMRGLTGDRILVLQNGQRTADLAGSADDHGVTVDPLTVERVEVIRGPATLLYGNNAMGGVVNVITRDVPTTIPARTDWTASLQSESAYPGASAGLTTVIPVSAHSAASFRLGARSASNLRIPTDATLGRRLTNSWSRSASGALGVGHNGETVAGGAALQVYDFDYGLPHPPGADPVSLSGRRYEGNARMELFLRSTIFPSIEAHATVQDYAHDELDQPSGNVVQRFELGTVTARATVRQGPFRRVEEGAWGVSILQRDYTASGSGALAPAAVSRGLGVFTFQSIDLGVPSLELGARVDDYRTASRTSERFGEGRSRTFGALSGSLGVRMPMGHGLAASFSVARSFRAPTVEELFSGAAHAGTGAVEFGNPGLRAERGMSLDAVLRLTNAGWNAQFAAYHHTIHDFVHLAARGDTTIGNVTLPVLAYTQDRARMRGLEGSVERALTPRLVVGVMGDYLHAALSDGTPLSYMPPPRLGSSIRWTDGTWSFGTDVHHEFRQDRTGAADERPTPAHTIVRLHSAVRFRLAGASHAVTLRAENLTNQLHREATSRVKDFAPGAGRNLSMQWTISAGG